MLLELGRDGSKVHTLSWAYCGKYDVRRADIGISRSRRSVLCIKHNHLLVDDLFRRFLNRFEDTMYHIYPQLVVLLSKYLYVPVALYPSFGISFVAHGALACILWSLVDSSPANTSASPIYSSVAILRWCSHNRLVDWCIRSISLRSRFASICWYCGINSSRCSLFHTYQFHRYHCTLCPIHIRIRPWTILFAHSIVVQLYQTISLAITDQIADTQPLCTLPSMLLPIP